eukprot:TRINITY_DN1401_c1_g2_i1.p1 TRINITY_DN1401_c1_g2~~TRINITY_DN1401_c1_g2_i1.p1  ORF type:complete len:1055 (+),score=276.12 TRINITY_DN1401_c1_g2_i1:129-3167(+)
MSARQPRGGARSGLLSERGWQNAERLLARLRENGMTEALEGELDRGLLRVGDPRPHVYLLRIIICAISVRCLEHIYQAHDWFLVLDDDAEFAEMVWKLCLHEFRYKPALSLNQFFRPERFADHKVAILIDLLRLVERLHNRLVRDEKRAERQRRRNSDLLRSEVERELRGSRSPELPPRHRTIRVAEPPKKPTYTYSDDGRDTAPAPNTLSRKPLRSVYKAGAHSDCGTTTDEEHEDPLPCLIGGKFASSMEAFDDADPIVLNHREDHPQYLLALKGCGRVPLKRGHEIPAPNVVPLRRANGTGIWALPNTRLPRWWTFSQLPGADFRCTLSGSSEVERDGSSEQIAAFEQARRGQGPSPASGRVRQSGRVRVKGFPRMLARALLKLPCLAPPTCPREERECAEFYRSHGVDRPPTCDPRGDAQAGSFWRERGGIIERTKERLRRKYEPREVIFVDAPADSGAGDGAEDAAAASMSGADAGDQPPPPSRTSAPNWVALDESGREILGMRWSERRRPDDGRPHAPPPLPPLPIPETTYGPNGGCRIGGDNPASPRQDSAPPSPPQVPPPPPPQGPPPEPAPERQPVPRADPAPEYGEVPSAFAAVAAGVEPRSTPRNGGATIASQRDRAAAGSRPASAPGSARQRRSQSPKSPPAQTQTQTQTERRATPRPQQQQQQQQRRKTQHPVPQDLNNTENASIKLPGLEPLGDGSYRLSAVDASQLLGVLSLVPAMMAELQGLRREVRRQSGDSDVAARLDRIEAQGVEMSAVTTREMQQLRSDLANMGQSMQRLGETMEEARCEMADCNDELRMTVEKFAEDTQYAPSLTSSLRSGSPPPPAAAIAASEHARRSYSGSGEGRPVAGSRGIIIDRARRRRGGSRAAAAAAAGGIISTGGRGGTVFDIDDGCDPGSFLHRRTPVQSYEDGPVPTPWMDEHEPPAEAVDLGRRRRAAESAHSATTGARTPRPTSAGIPAAGAPHQRASSARPETRRRPAAEIDPLGPARRRCSTPTHRS